MILHSGYADFAYGFELVNCFLVSGKKKKKKLKLTIDQNSLSKECFCLKLLSMERVISE